MTNTNNTALAELLQCFVLQPRVLKGPGKKNDRTSASSSDDDIRTDDDAPRRGRPPGSKDRGDSSDASSNRRQRGRAIKSRGIEGKGTPAKKVCMHTNSDSLSFKIHF